jgi:hypothetical protein
MGDLCSVFEGVETIGHKEVIFLSSGVGGVDALKEKVTVPIDNRVLKVVECGRFGGEAALPEVVLKFLNAILAGKKGFADIDGGGVVFDEQKDVADALWDMFEGLRSDDGFPFEVSVEPQVKGVVRHTGKQDEAAANDG